ncbi:hypothetical protein BDR26DRAFT_817329 [Obelidium mucronatum]|nr:hypothetical protein BDR26DRAFT_817329 [Obelidium mucronatum]
MTAIKSLKRESPAAAILGYCISSILMIITNKAIMGSYQFEMAFLVLAVQNSGTVLLLVASSHLSLLSYRKMNFKDAQTWFPIALALVMMMYTGAKTLQYMSISLFTIFKNLTIILIAYGELYLLNGAPITRMIFSSFSLLVVGSLVAGWTDISSGQGLISVDDGPNVLVAYFWMTSNCLTTAFFSLCLRAKMKQVSFKDFDTVYYNNFLSVPVLFLCSLVFEQAAFRRTYSRFINPGEESNQLSGLLMAVFLSSVCAFGVSYGTSMCVRLTSSTTYSMVGALNKLPISLSGMLFFVDPITFGSISGVILAFSGGVLYSYAKSEQYRTSYLPIENPMKSSHCKKESTIIVQNASTATLVSEECGETERK